MGCSTLKVVPHAHCLRPRPLTLSCLMMDWKQCKVPRYWGFSTLWTCSRT